MTSNDFNQRFASIERGKDVRQYLFEPAKQRPSPHVGMRIQTTFGPFVTAAPPKRKVFVLRDDNGGHCIGEIPDRTVGRRFKIVVRDMFRNMSLLNKPMRERRRKLGVDQESH